MDEVKGDDKTTVSVTEPSDEKVEASPASDSQAQADSETTAKKEEVAVKEAEPVKADPEPANVVPSQADKEQLRKEKEGELVELSGLLLCGLVVAMLYVGTVVFAPDSLLFFAGIFIYLIIAPPGTYGQGKSKMASFTKEVAIAFGLTFLLFLVFKAVTPALHWDDQARFLITILTILGVKLVFFPYYNFKPDDES